MPTIATMGYIGQATYGNLADLGARLPTAIRWLWEPGQVLPIGRYYIWAIH